MNEIPIESNPIRQLYERVSNQVRRVFVGQEAIFEGVLVALLSGGHVLVEGVPGLGKTLLSRAMGKVLGCTFKRIQFTPDLMPSDITGSHVFDEKSSDFKFHPGPIFSHIVLADEINRSPAKTHAALLEVMQERQVTVDGKRYKLPEPFLVVATQNPLETEGTYALPEAQLDRFMFKFLIPYPDESHEIEILKHFLAPTSPIDRVDTELKAVVNKEQLAAIRAMTTKVRVDASILGFVAKLVRKTREWDDLYQGASPRAGITLIQGSRTLAAIRNRNFVVPDDIVDLALPTFRHRVILSPEAEVEGMSVDQVLGKVIASVEVPR
ncbi:MAG: AAA family ATPase [Acidobacteria bacterium]|nr:AAA family ATPase [Acidobacteriota bacterium]